MKRFFLISTLLLSSLMLQAKPSWREIRIPILPEGASLTSLWAGLSGDLYVWTNTLDRASGDVPTARLLHWNGDTWRVDLELPGHEPAAVFGTDANNLFAAANNCAAGRAAGCGPEKGGRISRSTDGGRTWTPQALPEDMRGRFLGQMGGYFDNIQILVDNASLLRYDGAAWSWCFKGHGGDADGTLAVGFQGANEGYLVNCLGWGRWIDGDWKFMLTDFGFCAANGLWGLRDRKDALRLYAIDSDRFANGLRVWRFNPLEEDFVLEVEEKSEDNWGAAVGIWGPAEDDIYVVGWIGEKGGADAGRVYHYDGRSWKRDTSMGPIPAPTAIHGSSRNDVWVTLTDGRLLHYSAATTLGRRMSASPAVQIP